MDCVCVSVSSTLLFLPFSPNPQTHPRSSLPFHPASPSRHPKCTSEEDAGWIRCSSSDAQCAKAYSILLDNDLAAIDHVGCPLGGIERALCAAGDGDVERAVQVPCFQGGGCSSCPCLIEGASCAFAELVLAAVYADDEDGVSAQATGFGDEAGDGGVEAFSCAEFGEIAGGCAEVEECADVEVAACEMVAEEALDEGSAELEVQGSDEGADERLCCFFHGHGCAAQCMRARCGAVGAELVRLHDLVCGGDVPAPGCLAPQAGWQVSARLDSPELEQAGVDLTSRLCGGLDAPFAGDGGQGAGADVGVDCREDDGHGQTRVVAQQPFCGVVAEQMAAEDGERGVVEGGVGVGRGMHEGAGEGREGEALGEGQSTPQGVQLDGALGGAGVW